MDYKLIRSGRKTIAAEIKRGGLIVRAPYGASGRDIERFLASHEKWIVSHLEAARERELAAERAGKLTPAGVRDLARRARTAIAERVAYFAPIVGVTPGRIAIRSQRSRWGSCSSKGNLNFNCLLILTPPAVLDSVVVHELCHLKEMNHSRRFYAEVLRVMPDYRARDKWLKENGGALMAMLPDRGE